jgi:hypothetical protein
LGGTRILTPDYASPEQVRGGSMNTATDIYSLGVVLYELLTGAHAHQFAARTTAEIEAVICAKEVRRPSAIAPELRGDLDNILLKALEKDPDRRYAHVEEFANDIRRHLEGHPILARPASHWYRAGKFARRNKFAVVMASAVAIALAVGLFVALWQARVARREREIAERRFEMAREVAGSLLFEVHDAIEELAGLRQAREVLVNRSLKYLDALSQEARSSPALQRDLAGGYERAAMLQGATGVTNLGRTDAAPRQFAKSHRASYQRPGRESEVDRRSAQSCFHSSPLHQFSPAFIGKTATCAGVAGIDERIAPGATQ